MTMKAAILKKLGAPLVVETMPDPVLGTGEVPEIGYSQVGLIVTTFDQHGGVHLTHEADHHLGTDLFLQDDYLDRSCM